MATNTTGKALSELVEGVVIDVLMCLHLLMWNVRDKTYDGAANNMSDIYSGCQAFIAQNSHSHYINSTVALPAIIQ